MSRVIAAAAITAVALGSLGCEEPPELPPDARVVQDTIDGVVHVVSGGRGAWVQGGAWNVARTGITIGEAVGAPEYVFDRVAGVVVGRDGHIYVADGAALEVRVFSPQGSFLRRFGGRGDGPGEFRDIRGLARAPEGVAVLDGARARVTVFRPGGTLARSFDLDGSDRRTGHHLPMRFDERGRYYDPVILPVGPDGRGLGVRIHGRDGAGVETVRLGGALPRNRFDPSPSVAVGPDGRIYHALGDQYRITVLDPQGDTLRVLLRRVLPRPLAAEELGDSAVVLVRHEEMPPVGAAPAYKPIIAGLRVDDLGNLWVETYSDDHSTHLEWSVHDPAGRYLGEVATPRMDVLHIGVDFVAGVARDDDGMERVVVLPIRRQ
jgi:hypothetical protein